MLNSRNEEKKKENDENDDDEEVVVLVAMVAEVGVCLKQICVQLHNSIKTSAFRGERRYTLSLSCIV